MQHVETDPDTGVEIYQLTDDPRPADNIYGEQPYSSADSRRIAVRFYAHDGREGALAMLDLEEGSLETVLPATPRFPAFHAWGAHLYYQLADGDKLALHRCDYRTLAREHVADLPAALGRFSYGTVSADGRHYAVSVRTPDDSYQVVGVDLADGTWQVLVESRDKLFKHEQFAHDGSSTLMIQANQLPEVKQVYLGLLDATQPGIRYLAADQPHTPRVTGHEAWVGKSRRVFFSTDLAPDQPGNLWTVGEGDSEARRVTRSPLHFGHVSVSRCGRYWIGDAIQQPDVPIYIGAIDSDAMVRLLLSRTVHDSHQWSHTHPYFTADRRWLIYTSTRSGKPEVHGARIPDALWRRLEG